MGSYKFRFLLPPLALTSGCIFFHQDGCGDAGSSAGASSEGGGGAAIVAAGGGLGGEGATGGFTCAEQCGLGAECDGSSCGASELELGATVEALGVAGDWFLVLTAQGLFRLPSEFDPAIPPTASDAFVGVAGPGVIRSFGDSARFVVFPASCPPGASCHLACNAADLTCQSRTLPPPAQGAAPLGPITGAAAAGAAAIQLVTEDSGQLFRYSAACLDGPRGGCEGAVVSTGALDESGLPSSATLRDVGAHGAKTFWISEGSCVHRRDDDGPASCLVAVPEVAHLIAGELGVFVSVGLPGAPLRQLEDPFGAAPKLQPVMGASWPAALDSTTLFASSSEQSAQQVRLVAFGNAMGTPSPLASVSIPSAPLRIVEASHSRYVLVAAGSRLFRWRKP